MEATKPRELPFMTDESAAKFREKLIAKGIIKEDTRSYREGEHPYLDGERLQKYIQKLITTGILKPKPLIYGTFKGSHVIKTH
jgi:hypothetical protein